MNIRWTSLVCLLMLCVNGCIPLGEKVTLGYKFSPEALDFLNSSNTTRDDVVATLGPPFLEMYDSRVFLYIWKTQSKYLVAELHYIDADGNADYHFNKVKGDDHESEL